MDRHSFIDQSISISTLNPAFDPHYLENASNGCYEWPLGVHDLDGSIFGTRAGGIGHFDSVPEDLALDHLETPGPESLWRGEPRPFDEFDEKHGIMDSASPQMTQACSQKDEKLFCHLCDRFFDNRSELEDHAKLSGHPCFVCKHPGCGKSYNRRDVYSRHKKTHQTTAAFPCNLCDTKPFKRKDHLQQHKKTCHPSTVRSSISGAAGSHHRLRKAASFCHNCDHSNRTRRGSDDSVSDTESQYKNSAVCNIVDQISSYLGDDTEDALRLLLKQVELQNKPHSCLSTR